MELSTARTVTVTGSRWFWRQACQPSGRPESRRPCWRVPVLALGLLGAVLAGRKCGAQTRTVTTPPAFAFLNVAVIPMDRERVLPDQTVIVQGDRIVALGSATRVRVPAGARRIDGRGKFLIPGLADMHAHVPGELGMLRSFVMRQGAELFDADARAEAERMLVLSLANGVTTLRVMQGWAGTLRLRERVAQGDLLGPRLYVARRAIELGHYGWQDSAVRIVEDVAAAKAAGYDLYKVHGAINGVGAAHDSLVAAARRVGLLIAGHSPERPADKALEIALQAGYASVEHLTGFAGYLTPDQGGAYLTSWPEGLAVDEGKLRAIAAALQRAGVWICPTEILFEEPDDPATTEWPELRYIADTTVAMFKQSRATWQSERGDSGRRIKAMAHRRALDVRRRIIRALRDAGAGLLLGADVAGPPLVPGFAVHRELQALVDAGLTPYEALATGTRNVAAYFGTLDSTGTIAVGKRADLVLLAGNPLHDIRRTARPAGVMLGGRWWPRAALDRLLAPLAGTLYQPMPLVGLAYP